jgi:hypothetical protein
LAVGGPPPVPAERMCRWTSVVASRAAPPDGGGVADTVTWAAQGANAEPSGVHRMSANPMADGGGVADTGLAPRDLGFALGFYKPTRAKIWRAAHRRGRRFRRCGKGR